MLAGAVKFDPGAGLTRDSVGGRLGPVRAGAEAESDAGAEAEAGAAVVAAPGVTEPGEGKSLSVNEVGFGLLPLHLPLKPTVVDPLVGREAFQDRLTPVMFAPDCDQVAD